MWNDTESLIALVRECPTFCLQRPISREKNQERSSKPAELISFLSFFMVSLHTHICVIFHLNTLLATSILSPLKQLMSFLITAFNVCYRSLKAFLGKHVHAANISQYCGVCWESGWKGIIRNSKNISDTCQREQDNLIWFQPYVGEIRTKQTNELNTRKPEVQK